MLFLAVAGYVYAALMVAGGMVLLFGIAGNDLSAGFLGTVIMWFLYAAVVMTGSVLLNLYYNAIGQFNQSRSEADLDFALRRLRSFWVFVGIVAIVITVNLIIAAILVFSAAASVADALS